MISDCEYNNIKLPSKIYQKIEEKVSILYVELNINKMPIDPFDIANRRGYIVKPFSDLKCDVRSLLLSKELDGTSYFDPMLNKFVICYDDNQCTNRIRFTLMHEIGHIDLGHRQESDLARKMSDYYAAYSLAPSPIMHLYNCQDYIDVAKTWVGAYWQSKGLTVIPTISWGLSQSYEFCFDGIEQGSTVAVGMIGCKQSRIGFIRGYNEMLERLQPEKIIVFGSPFPEMKGNIAPVDYRSSRKVVR